MSETSRIDEARERLKKRLEDPRADFRAWTVMLSASHWSLHGPDWLAPYSRYLSERPADVLPDADADLVTSVQARCALHRMIAADLLVATTNTASLASVNDFTLFRDPAIYFREPDLIRIRRAYAAIASAKYAAGINPKDVVTRVELFSRSMLRQAPNYRQQAFASFLVEQAITNGFSVKLVDTDSVAVSIEEFGLYDNHVVLLDSNSATVWTSAKGKQYPSFVSVVGDVDGAGESGVLARIREYGHLYGVQLHGLSEDEICALIGVPAAPQLHGELCFISYAHENEDFARQLVKDLESYGVECWFAPADLRIGARARETIHRVIADSDKLLLILSEASTRSDWVADEVERALEIERRDDRTILFPVRIDNSVMKTGAGWPVSVRNTRNIGDLEAGTMKALIAQPYYTY